MTHRSPSAPMKWYHRIPSSLFPPCDAATDGRPAHSLTLSPSNLFACFSPASTVDREDGEFQCKSPLGPPALIDAKIHPCIYLFLKPKRTIHRMREIFRTRKGLHLSDGWAEKWEAKKRKENRCRTYNLFHMYPAAHFIRCVPVTWLTSRLICMIPNRRRVAFWCLYDSLALFFFIKALCSLDSCRKTHLNICPSINQ